MRYEETAYGFQWGPITVERQISDSKQGFVTLGLKTPKADLQVYVTKTGKVRVSGPTNASGNNEWKCPVSLKGLEIFWVNTQYDYDADGWLGPYTYAGAVMAREEIIRVQIPRKRGKSPRVNAQIVVRVDDLPEFATKKSRTVR